jgi:8-oxo-dGTP pyrophosphatase MutT (NUDIX family)
VAAKPKMIARQYGVIPFRVSDDGDVEIMLITSRDTGRWVVPKGWPISKLKPKQVAVREALEEAGAIGVVVGKSPVGKYRYEKRIEDERSIDCEVTLFLFRVKRLKSAWKEQGQRKLEWFLPEEASALVAEPKLSRLIAGVPRKLKLKSRKVRSKHGEPATESHAVA